MIAQSHCGREMDVWDRIDSPEALLAVAEGEFGSYPAFIAVLAEQVAIVQRVANRFGWSFQRAMSELEDADNEAMETFKVGNAIPWQARH
jgi:hypothetical protein